MTKEYNWQIINMSVMPFCHWQAACTYHVCAPSNQTFPKHFIHTHISNLYCEFNMGVPQAGVEMDQYTW